MHHVSLSVKIGYSSGNLGKSLVWATLDYFIIFILTEYWGLSGGEAGLVLLLALCWDASIGPVFGVLADRISGRWGKYGPWLAFGAPLVAATFWLQFRVVPGGGSAFWWALSAAFAFRTAYAVCDVPHNALMSRISRTAPDAAFIAGARFFFSSVGGMISAYAGSRALSLEDPSAQVASMLNLAILAGGIYVVAVWSAWLSTWRIDRERPNPSARISVADSIRRMRSNPLLLMLLAVAATQAASVPFFVKSLAYYASYVIERPSWAGEALLIVTASQAVSMPAWIWLCRVKSVARALGLSYGVAIVGFLGFAFAHSITAQAFTAAFVILGVAFGGMSMALWALLPQVIHAGEDSNGRWVEAAPTGVFLFTLKAAAGLSAGAFGIGLDATGLPTVNPGDAAFTVRLTVLMLAVPIAGLVFASLLVRAVLHSSNRFRLLTEGQDVKR